jgi:ubiquinone/menaquinone biosynthesis C-methylase UbiE
MCKTLRFLIVLIFLCSCARNSSPPYEHGPVMTQRSIRKTFQPLLDFMEVRPGMTFADFGAGSGAITVMMSSLMTNSDVYIQDIDTVVLNDSHLNRVLTYYTQQSAKDLRKSNRYNLVIGDFTRTKLPQNAFDVIYTNATMHVVDERDSILQDLKTKLKPEGRLFVRDSFSGDHKEGAYCSDKKCGKALLTIEEFLALMERNGFRLIKRSPDMSGYPVFGFVVAG